MLSCHSVWPGEIYSANIFQLQKYLNIQTIQNVISWKCVNCGHRSGILPAYFSPMLGSLFSTMRESMGKLIS